MTQEQWILAPNDVDFLWMRTKDGYQIICFDSSTPWCDFTLTPDIKNYMRNLHCLAFLSFTIQTSILFHTFHCHDDAVRFPNTSDQHYHRLRFCAGHKCCSCWTRLEYHLHQCKSRWPIWTQSRWCKWAMAVSIGWRIQYWINNKHFLDPLLFRQLSMTRSRSMYTMHLTGLQVCMLMGCSKMGRLIWMVLVWWLSGKIPSILIFT